jgi:Raf kinase inhibitor-like YbhB/YbcL family protein
VRRRDDLHPLEPRLQRGRDDPSLTLIVDDPDARGFAHWVLFDLAPAASSAVPAGVSVSPDAPPQGMNDFGRRGYAGPCPPSGSHRYVFTLYALDTLLSLPGSPRPEEVRQALRGHVLAEARLTASYQRR